MNDWAVMVGLSLVAGLAPALPVCADTWDPTLPAESEGLQVESALTQAEQPAEASEELTLSAIYMRDNKPFAVINGEIVHVGDVVAGRTVQIIDQDSVQLQHADTTEQLRLLSNQKMKQP